MIEGLYDLAYRAFSGTSFSPERRAKDTVEWIEAQLKEDLELIAEAGTARGDYGMKYISLARTWLNAKSRCLSTMITGPANFPTARNIKNNRYEDNAYKNWMSWREKYIKAVFRVPTPSPEEDLDKALKDYEKANENQIKMKALNSIIRKKSISEEEKVSQCVEYGFPEEAAIEMMKPDCHGRIGFPGYALTNNNAKIKRLKEKVLIMKSRIARKESWEPLLFEGGMVDIRNDRVVIIHDEKPGGDVIAKIKAKGFRWSRNYECWSRKHTGNALYDARVLVGLK